MDKLLKIDSFSLSLCVNQARHYILKNINLALDSGTILSLVGQSGSGKSMLAKSVLSLTEHLASCQTEGHIYLKVQGDYIDIVQAKSKELRNIRNKEIGMVFQQSKESFNPAFKIGEQIKEKLILAQDLKSDEAQQKVKRTLEEVGLKPADRFYQSYPHQLSGGQIQRSLIAMALINDPKILIADEPSSALDQALKKGVMDLIKKLNDERGLTVLLISHDLKLVSAISDRIAIIDRGQIIEYGDAQKLISQPEQSHTKSLLACQPPMGKKVKRLATLSDFEKNPELSTRDYYDQQSKSFDEIESRRNHINGSEILLKVRKLAKQYKRDSRIFGSNKDLIDVFKSLNFSVKKGVIFGLLGPSGSGKSTLARIIAGFEKQDNGWIKYKGKNTKGFSISDKAAYQKKVQYIFQDPLSAMAPHLNVGDILNESISLVNPASEPISVEQLLIQVGLNRSYIKKLPREMSGGERQRILIARALVFKPELLICDEILSALDVSSQAQIINLLLKLNQENNITILFITHDEPLLRFIADNILVLDS